MSWRSFHHENSTCEKYFTRVSVLKLSPPSLPYFRTNAKFLECVQHFRITFAVLKLAFFVRCAEKKKCKKCDHFESTCYCASVKGFLLFRVKASPLLQFFSLLKFFWQKSQHAALSIGDEIGVQMWPSIRAIFSWVFTEKLSYWSLNDVEMGDQGRRTYHKFAFHFTCNLKRWCHF